MSYMLNKLRKIYVLVLQLSNQPGCCWVTHLCLTLCDPMDCSTPGFPVLYHVLGFAQTHVLWVSDAIQPSYPLWSPSHAFNLSQHQGLFSWVRSSHQVAKVLELQLQHQSFQWIFSQESQFIRSRRGFTVLFHIYVEFISFSCQGTKENKPGFEVRETEARNERVSGDGLGAEIPRVANGERFFGKEKSRTFSNLASTAGE